MNTAARKLGQRGEALAADYLVQKGYQILFQNERNSAGEIDLIAQQGEEIVFVEVKTRSSNQYGYPEEAVTPQKQAHMIAAAQTFLQAHSELENQWRIDVIAIRIHSAENSPEIVHFENAIS